MPTRHGLTAPVPVPPHRLPRRSFLRIGALGLVLSLGRHTPAYALLVRLLPPLAVLRYPSKALALVALAASLLAGMGVDSFREAPTAGAGAHPR